MSSWAFEILKKQSQSLLRLADSLDENFERAIDCLVHCSGKIIVSGVGKSGLVARKIAASLTCVGSPAVFLHPTDALHGDIGLLNSHDKVIFVSHSGQTHELLAWLPILRRLKCDVLCVTGHAESPLALISQIILDTQVKKEACPLDFLPTTSSLCSMALGDLLALGIMQRRKITLGDMKARHPQGHLGERVCFI